MTKRELYIKAKEEYYRGTPILSDAEFDVLEQEVGVGAVGAKDADAKFSHPTKMLSLSKFQADKITGSAPTEQAMNWMNNLRQKSNDKQLQNFKITCKYDGNSVNCIYRDGKLERVLTRGDGFTGRDITNKIKHIIPQTIKFKGVCEVRGEVIMRKSVFNAKYKDKFANPRNLVAGILGRDDDAMIEDLCVISYDCKMNDEYYTLDTISELGFNTDEKPYETTFNCIYDDFDELFERMLDIREKSDFPLDGFVIKTPSQYKSFFGENDHDPEWGKAIKFKPVGVETEVIDIEWNIGKTGEFIPKAILNPIDVDGSTVSRVALYNAGYVVNNNIEAGTRVRIAKSGDIIPQIIEVFK